MFWLNWTALKPNRASFNSLLLKAWVQFKTAFFIGWSAPKFDPEAQKIQPVEEGLRKWP